MGPPLPFAPPPDSSIHRMGSAVGPSQCNFLGVHRGYNHWFPPLSHGEPGRIPQEHLSPHQLAPSEGSSLNTDILSLHEILSIPSPGNCAGKGPTWLRRLLGSLWEVPGSVPGATLSSAHTCASEGTALQPVSPLHGLSHAQEALGICESVGNDPALSDAVSIDPGFAWGRTRSFSVSHCPHPKPARQGLIPHGCRACSALRLEHR